VLSIDGGSERSSSQFPGKSACAQVLCTGFEKKYTLYLKSIRDFDVVNEVYEMYFHTAPPARAAVEVEGLAKDSCVEIDAVALA
jgi:hypothetical protein